MTTSNKILTGTYGLGLLCLLSIIIAMRVNMVEPTVIEGTGEITTTEKSIDGFTQLRVSNTIKVHLVPSAEPYMKIMTNPNLQEALNYKEDAGHLTLFLADSIQIRSGVIRVELGVQKLEQLDLVGASEVSMDSTLQVDFLNVGISGASNAQLSLIADQLNVELNGASGIEMNGKTDFIDIRSTGASTVKAIHLEADKVHLNLYGASNASIHAVQLLKVRGYGASTVKYKGDPVRVDKSLHGAASVSKF